MLDERIVRLHGHSISVTTGGTGPALLLVHGMAGSAETWRPVAEHLAGSCRVIAPDLPGHGRSDKPKLDYTLGTYAATLRDLLDVLDCDSATVVGHSLGGGITMQLAYQHPHVCDRLVLVASGGLGSDVSPILRGLSLPGAEYLLSVVTHHRTRDSLTRLGSLAARVGLQPLPELAEIGRAYSSLGDPAARAAFLQPLRSVIDVEGQTVSAHDRLHLADVPTLIVWGDRDRIIPVSHAHAAHRAIADSRLEIFEGAGHFPHRECPDRFTAILGDFLATTTGHPFSPA